MADPTKRDETGNQVSSEEAALAARLKSLDARLDKASAEHVEKTSPRSAPTSDSNALGQALRFSAEFVSGVVAGALVGWLIDRLFDTAPWGLIVCLILGFCAGMLNLMRAAGLMKPARTDKQG